MKTHLCSRELYCSFLTVTAQRYSAVTLSDVAPTTLSHDAVSRWLTDAKCQPKDIWEKAKECVMGKRGILIADDTVLNKNRSNKIELVNWQYSGTEHDIVKGIGMVNFVWADSDTGDMFPVDYRIYNPPEDGKTKNEHVQEMATQAKQRGLDVEAIVMDAWYSSLHNLKHLRDLGWIWVAGLRKNRVVNRGEKLGELDIPDDGVKLHLRGYGWIRVFRFVATNGRMDYFGTNMEDPTREKVERLVKIRWSVEVYHRELKQTCGLERCQSRIGRSQRNHIGLSVLSWIRKAKRRNATHLSMYQQQWDIIKQSIAANFKQEFMFYSTA